MRVALLALALCAEPARDSDLWDRLNTLFSPPAEFKDQTVPLRPLLKFDDGREVRSADDWKARRAEILKRWNDLLGPWPPLLEKPVVQEQFKEEVEGFTRSRVEFDIAPGRKTAAFLLRPAGPGPFPAVIDVFYYPEDRAGLKADRRQQNDYGYQ